MKRYFINTFIHSHTKKTMTKVSTKGTENGEGRVRDF